MEDGKPNLTVIEGGGRVVPIRGALTGSPPPPPGGALNARERQIWDYICEQLRAVGIEHRTFGLAAVMVCRTYIDWLDASDTLEKVKQDGGGSIMVRTPNGYEQPHQAYHLAKSLRRDLLQWLPECCLTIPSYAIAKSKLGDNVGQLDIAFEDLQDHAIAERESYARR